MKLDTLVPEADADLPAYAKALNDQGFFLQVLPLLPRLKGLADIEGVLEAARATGHLGAHRAGDALVASTWRNNRQSPAAMTGFLRSRSYRRGPYVAWALMKKLVWPADAPIELSAEFVSLQSYVLANLRDFESAQVLHEKAIALLPDDPWIWVEWSYVCERRDRRDAALDAVLRALAAQPGYRPAVQMHARLLNLAGKADEAFVLLEHEFARAESGSLGAQLYELQYERGMNAEAWATLDRIEQLEPLADKYARAWMASRRADVALRQGRLDVAREQAEKGNGPFYAPIAERLARGEVAPKTVLLPVGLVPQHWMTCAPATLTSIARYWGRPAEHLEIAEEICYDGTPNHAERRWAESQGFAVREFTADWDSSRALLDAGIPFTLTTTYTAAAHLQAVVGYDVIRNSLLIRDPSLDTHTEYEATSLFETYRSTGPRGMAIAPLERAAELAALPLPESSLWDEYHVLMAALARHDREAAQGASDRLEALHPGHRLSLSARNALALYDGDENEVLATTEARLALFPDDSNLHLTKASSLWSIGGRAAHIAWLAQLANRPRPEPLALIRYADRLAEDGRRLEQAFGITRKALRIAQVEGAAWSQMAALFWQRGDFREALGYYRIAACLRDTHEESAASYFRACRFVREIESGLRFLRERVARFGDKSAGPACTLFDQLDSLERAEEAFAVLDEALARRPDDAALLTFHAEAKFRYGKLDEAQALLERTPATSRRADWLRVQGLIVEAQGNLAAALEYAREASGLDPLNLRQHRMVASLLSRLEGRAAAVQWLRQACTRFPRNFGLQKLLYDWLDANDVDTCEAQLRDMVASHPGDVWTLREIASILVRRQRFEEAWRFARSALARGAEQAATHTTLAYLAIKESGYEAAVPHLKHAVTLEVDNDYAINVLINEAPTLAQRREALDFVWSELLRQVTVGDGLLTFQGAARSVMPDEELLESLQFALKERPDLWHAWVATLVQLCDMGRSAEALTLAEEATRRFPMLPVVYLHQARAFILQGERESARTALERVLAISPGWGRAVRMFVDTIVDEGAGFDRAEQVVRKSLLRQTDNADLRGLLGWLLERQKRDAEALDEVLLSLKQDPDQGWVWDMARRLFERQGKPEQIDAMIAEVVQSQPGDPAVWIISAQKTQDVDKSLQSVLRALELDPKRVNAWQTRFDILLKAERYDEIDALLPTLPWGEHAPIRLRAFGPRVLAARGQRQQACERMRELVAVEPNEYELWRELADWYDTDDKHADYLAAAHELVRIAPNHAYAHGYVGHALMKSDRAKEAMPCFRRALELDPMYMFGATHLADIALKQTDVDAALWALDTVAPHFERAFLSAQRVEAHCIRKDRVAAMAAFRDVLRLGEEDGKSVTRAIDFLRHAGWYDDVVKEIVAAIRRGECAWTGVRHWVDELGRGLDGAGLYRKVKNVLPDDKAQVLKHQLLNWSAEKSDTRCVKALVKAYRDQLKADDTSWGLVGRAFLTTREWKTTIAWQSDWRTRPVTPVWALDNLANAFFNLGRRHEAFDVIHKAAVLDPDDADIQLWLAAEAALQHDMAQFGQILGRVDTERLMGYMKPVLRALQAYLLATSCGKSSEAVGEFLASRGDRQTNPALNFLMRDLARDLVKAHTPWWAMPVRALQLGVL